MLPTLHPAAPHALPSLRHCPLQSFLGQQGIVAPTDVQAGAIPAVLSGDNVAVRCYTGSGKTLAYLLPALTLAVQRAEQEWAGVTRKTKGQAGTVQVGAAGGGGWRRRRGGGACPCAPPACLPACIQGRGTG